MSGTGSTSASPMAGFLLDDDHDRRMNDNDGPSLIASTPFAVVNDSFGDDEANLEEVELVNFVAYNIVAYIIGELIKRGVSKLSVLYQQYRVHRLFRRIDNLLQKSMFN